MGPLRVRPLRFASPGAFLRDKRGVRTGVRGGGGVGESTALSIFPPLQRNLCVTPPRRRRRFRFEPGNPGLCQVAVSACICRAPGTLQETTGAQIRTVRARPQVRASYPPGACLGTPGGEHVVTSSTPSSPISITFTTVVVMGHPPPPIPIPPPLPPPP